MEMKKTSVRAAMIQSAPVVLDLEQSMEKAVSLVEEAAAQGAELTVFGETWLSGYPAWIDHCPGIALWNNEPAKEVFALMHQNSIQVPGKETRVLGELARKHRMVICTGANETVAGTIYNSLLLFGGDGRLVTHHRKLMPTYNEKLLYGLGDGAGLGASETHLGRIGGLICWEHWMPLARQAMHNSNEHIHIALWPTVNELHQMAGRHYALEARCFVVAVGQIMRVRDFPGSLTLPPHLQNNPDELILQGGSCVYGPDGTCLSPPQWKTEGVFLFDITRMDRIAGERMTLDTSGHYNRDDIFSFQVNRERK